MAPIDTHTRANPPHRRLRNSRLQSGRTGLRSPQSDRTSFSLSIGRLHDQVTRPLVATVGGDLDRRFRQAGPQGNLDDVKPLDLEQLDDLALLQREKGEGTADESGVDAAFRIRLRAGHAPEGVISGHLPRLP